MLALVLLLACSGPKESSEVAADCNSLSPSDCGTRSDCAVITGSPVTFEDTGGGCYTVGTAEPLGCMPAGNGCDEAEYWVNNTDGCWFFRNGCLPEGWSGQGTVQEACAAAEGIPACG
ncbi:MAG TPA: hypothetical protein PKY30_24190 [Myxococcota bacterium]|nr:hypothetical protein [Myxococcota bacterium]HNH50157.1 hypothetical protein [Myxococcota bacterium]